MLLGPLIAVVAAVTNAQSGGDSNPTFAAGNPSYQSERPRLFFASLAQNGQPRWRVGRWGACSASCGHGVMVRQVKCVIYHENNPTPTEVSDYDCRERQKPSFYRSCKAHDCPQNDHQSNDVREGLDQQQQRLRTELEPSALGQRVYQWDYGEWGPCSASCRGGKQRAALKCIDVVRKISVPWTYCDAKQRPLDSSRACNTHPCPSDWEVGPFSPCSQSCGAGYRTRQVRCVQKIGGVVGNAESTLILSDDQCSVPSPHKQETCGYYDCPPQWKTSEWSACSQSCDGGEQRRSVVCEQQMASGDRKQHYPPIACGGLPKPPSVQLCNTVSCFAAIPFADSSHPSSPTYAARVFDQQQNHHRKLTLNVGGKANLYLGTSIKIKCPVRNFDKHKIVWTKNGKKIVNNAHIKVSSNGALRIFHARMEDEGLYECYAGKAQGNVTLTFKHRENDVQGPDSSENSIFSTTPDGTEDNETDEDDHDAAEANRDFIQNVRMSLQKHGEQKIFERLKTINDPSKIRADWAIGEWSSCPKNLCGKAQASEERNVKCRIYVENLNSIVDDDICVGFGIAKPIASRPCADECPHWVTSEWSPCESGRCTRHVTSIQRRQAFCQYSNGTKVDNSMCDRTARPKIKRECMNANCTAEWRPSNWGSCSQSCGDGGLQMRILRCVWKGTRKAAGSNCRTSTRPSAIRSCVSGELPACEAAQSSTEALVSAAPPFKGPAANAQCEDKSRHCDILKLFQLCSTPEIKASCCYSCHYLNNS
uniref:Ig-like domain-containing protein n=1 Tax=Steinernema glaseri TaxID=37863 RepID=A0A1I8ANC8_9BILA